MNNSDFQRLLLTNDKELISELTKAPPKAKKANKRPPPKHRKGAGKGKSTGGEEGAGKDGSAGGQGPQYRDRAKERREMKGEYEQIAAEWENHGEVSVDESKYLGGDFDHTHLVKGLDYALLTKVRTELTKQKKVQEIQQVRLHKKGQKKQREFLTDLGKKVWNAVVETLHPHHSTFKQRVEKMSQAISMGQRMRAAPSVFLPGRMFYEFDTELEQSKTDIPRIVYTSKEDAPKVDTSKTVAPVLPETVGRVQEALQRATEERKQRKRDKAAGTQPSYTVAQKIAATKHKAKDVDNDIFQGAGGFDPVQAVEAAKKAKAKTPPVAGPGTRVGKPSYFDDAGSEKYTQAPQGQIELQDLVVEEGAAESAGTVSEACFEAAERFAGAKAGWVFKLGPLGLGYYADTAPRKAKPATSSSAGEGQARLPTRRVMRNPDPDDEEEGAYGECFPSSGLGHALVQTGEADSDEEAPEDAKKRRAQLGKKKDGKKDGKNEGGGKKDMSDPKKRKMSEAQQWQKIDHMIKKGKHSSLDQLEAQMRTPGGFRGKPIQANI